MSLIDILLPPALDPKQALRLRRFGLAALSYALSMALVAVAWRFGVMSAAAVIKIAIGYLAINLGLYAAIRSGFNLRFKDPSLTVIQILTGITIIMYIAYHMDDGRNYALFGCFLVFLFGTFHLSNREFSLVTLYTLAAYAMVINLLMRCRPAAIRDVPSEWLSWLMLAGFLPWFSIVGGKVNALRRKLRESAEQLRLFTDNVPAMTVSYDEHLRCRFVNQRFADFFGLTVRNTLGMHLRDVVGEPTFKEIEGHYAQVLLGQPVTYQRTHRLDSGELRHLEIRLLPHMSENGRSLGCFSVAADITEHKLTEERIQRMAHHDSLTGLPNRLLFNDRLSQAISLARRDSGQFALLYLDLNKFKPVNDRFGHAAGDELLRSVAGRIRQQIRESDTLARIGGDEFTVILSEVSGRDDAEIVARKIDAALVLPFRLSGVESEVAIGVSIGIAVYPSDGQDADALVKAADAAMYTDKYASRA